MTKFFNKPGNGYHSIKEGRRAGELVLMQKLGLISDLREQVKFEVIPKQKGEQACAYVADFVYQENGLEVVEDCKGFRTRDYIIKRKLMLLVHGKKIKET